MELKTLAINSPTQHSSNTQYEKRLGHPSFSPAAVFYFFSLEMENLCLCTTSSCSSSKTALSSWDCHHLSYFAAKATHKKLELMFCISHNLNSTTRPQDKAASWTTYSRVHNWIFGRAQWVKKAISLWDLVNMNFAEKRWEEIRRN